MHIEISEEESHKAKIPHEIFLTNLIGNHILWFIASMGLVRSMWVPLALVPVYSIGSLVYTLWRAKRSKEIDSWFVMCHWQVAARRSKVFVVMLSVMSGVAIFGWIAYTYWGLQAVTVKALLGGLCILPTMVTVLVLIVMESDALHQAKQHCVYDSIAERFPNPDTDVPN